MKATIEVVEVAPAVPAITERRVRLDMSEREADSVMRVLAHMHTAIIKESDVRRDVEMAYRKMVDVLEVQGFTENPYYHNSFKASR